LSASTTTHAEPLAHEAAIRIGAFLAISVLLHAALIIASADRLVPAMGGERSPVLEISLRSAAGRAVHDEPPPPTGRTGAKKTPEPAAARLTPPPSPSPADRPATDESRQITKTRPTAPGHPPAGEAAIRAAGLASAGTITPAVANRLEAGSPPGESAAVRAVDADPASQARLEQSLQRALLSHFTYPRRARKHGWQGSLKLGLRIESNGELTNIRVIESSGYNVLDRAALESARKIRILESHHVAESEPREMVIPVEFRLVDG
jgi:protein TonB